MNFLTEVKHGPRRALRGRHAAGADAAGDADPGGVGRAARQQLASDAEKKQLEAVVATQAAFVAAVKKVATTMRTGDNDAAREAGTAAFGTPRAGTAAVVVATLLTRSVVRPAREAMAATR